MKWNNFVDYLASQITPQMTLLEKYNKIIEYLKQYGYPKFIISSAMYDETIAWYPVSSLGSKEKITGSVIFFKNGFVGLVTDVTRDNTQFYVKAEDVFMLPAGERGETGNGIVSIHTLSHSSVGRETVTKIEVATDDNNQTFEVHAQNGVTTNDNIYIIQFTTSSPNFYEFRIPVRSPLARGELKFELTTNFAQAMSNYCEILSNVKMSTYDLGSDDGIEISPLECLSINQIKVVSKWAFTLRASNNNNTPYLLNSWTWTTTNSVVSLSENTSAYRYNINLSSVAVL